jgi:hypothetical protein
MANNSHLLSQPNVMVDTVDYMHVNRRDWLPPSNIKPEHIRPDPVPAEYYKISSGSRPAIENKILLLATIRQLQHWQLNADGVDRIWSYLKCRVVGEVIDGWLEDGEGRRNLTRRQTHPIHQKTRHECHNRVFNTVNSEYQGYSLQFLSALCVVQI